LPVQTPFTSWLRQPLAGRKASPSPLVIYFFTANPLRKTSYNLWQHSFNRKGSNFAQLRTSLFSRPHHSFPYLPAPVSCFPTQSVGCSLSSTRPPPFPFFAPKSRNIRKLLLGSAIRSENIAFFRMRYGNTQTRPPGLPVRCTQGIGPFFLPCGISQEAYFRRHPPVSARPLHLFWRRPIFSLWSQGGFFEVIVRGARPEWAIGELVSALARGLSPSTIKNFFLFFGLRETCDPPGPWEAPSV